MLEKARQGIWPSFAPLGYTNVDGPAGKRIIVPDSVLAPVITDAIYMDKLDGRIGSEFFDAKAAEMRKGQGTLMHEIERHETANRSYI